MPFKDPEVQRAYNRQRDQCEERKAYRRTEAYRAYQAAYREKNRAAKREYSREYAAHRRRIMQEENALPEYPLQVLDEAYAALYRALEQRRIWKRRQANAPTK